MAHPSFTVPDDTLDEFDDEIWELQKEEILPRGGQRSALVTAMIQDALDEGLGKWLERHPELQEGEPGNRMSATVTAD